MQSLATQDKHNLNLFLSNFNEAVGIVKAAIV